MDNRKIIYKGSTVGGGSFSFLDTDWVDCPYLAGYTTRQGSDGVPKIQAKISGGTLFIRGAVSPTSGSFTANTQVNVATLPATIGGIAVACKYGYAARTYASGSSNSGGFAQVELVNNVSTIQVCPNAATSWTSFYFAVSLDNFSEYKGPAIRDISEMGLWFDEETQVGTWANDLPVYAKSYMGAISAGTGANGDVNLSIPNVAFCVDVEGWWSEDANVRFAAGTTLAATDKTVRATSGVLRSSPNQLVFRTFSGFAPRSSQPYSITVYYTKE